MKIVIVGAGDVGSFLARELSTRSEDVVMIDCDSSALERVEESTDIMTLQGNGTFRKTLIEAGVQKADLVVAVTSNDDTNMVVSSLSSGLGASRTLARVDTPDFLMTKAGVERNVLNSFAIICASRLTSSELLRLVRRAESPFVETFSTDSISLAIVNVDDKCRFLNKPGTDIELGKEARVVGIFRDQELRRQMEISHLYAGDQILVATNLRKLPMVMRRISQTFSGKKGVIIGGGDVGFQLAESLQSVENRLTIIDINRKQCEHLADVLDKVTVVHGDGTSLPLLQDEHVEMADYLLSVTRHDEVNLMSSLVAQEIGVTDSYTLVHRPGYSHVYEHLGVKGTASAHELIAKVVSKYFPNQTILSQSEIPNSDYIAGEFQIADSIVSKTVKLRDLSLPIGSIIVGRSRNEKFEFADGEMDIFPSDALIIVCKKMELKSVEAVLRKIK